MADERKIREIENYGRRYLQTNEVALQIARRDIVKTEWFEGLRFFFSKSFYRGRLDEISELFQQRTEGVLARTNLRLFSEDFDLDRALLDAHVNNSGDRQMVGGTLRYIAGLPNRNIVSHAIEQITSGRVRELHSELQQIPYVADKIASFYVRDIVLTFDLEPTLKKDELEFCQPIDTWVRQVASALEIAPRSVTPSATKRAIILTCQAAKVSPLLFNAGAWMTGSKAFALLLERL